MDWSSREQSLWTAGGCEDLPETARDPALAAPCALELWPGGAGKEAGAGGGTHSCTESLRSVHHALIGWLRSGPFLPDITTGMLGHAHQP